jgi:hypothetical protein
MKEGYAEHFVGRRREQQRLLPALRSGDLQVVIITSLGGSGKSTWPRDWLAGWRPAVSS